MRYQQAGKQDEELFQEIYDVFKPMIHGMVSNKITNAADAEDIVSECVIALWRALGTMPYRNSVTQWRY